MNLSYVSGPQDIPGLRADLNDLIRQLNSKSPGLINAQGGSVGSSAGGTDDTLFGHQFQANDFATMFPANAYPGTTGFRVTGWATTAANANNKTAKLLLGATTLISTGAVALNAGVFWLEAIVLRTGVSTQKMYAKAIQGTTLIAASVQDGVVDETAAQLLRMTGNTGTLNDILGKGFMVEALR